MKCENVLSLLCLRSAFSHFHSCFNICCLCSVSTPGFLKFIYVDCLVSMQQLMGSVGIRGLLSGLWELLSLPSDEKNVVPHDSWRTHSCQYMYQGLISGFKTS